MGVHAASPVGHLSSTQSCAAPGWPLTPTQLHCQQPQSFAVEQDAPGGVGPGPGPVIDGSEHAPAEHARASTPTARVTSEAAREATRAR
jgi:hypothetical protein